MILQQTLDSLALFLPETILTATVCITLLAGLIARGKPAVSATVSLLGVLAAAWAVIRHAGTSQVVFSGLLAVDPFAAFFKIVVSVSVVFVMLFSLFSSEIRTSVRRVSEYYALLVSMTLGMFLMTGATNLLMMVLAIEMTSLPSYLLAGFTKEAPDSSEASLKYVIYGAVSSAMMLYGISILFGMTGSLGFADVNRGLAGGLPRAYALMAASLLIVVGFGYKISAVPFHFWTPDVYEGAPITITAFLSVASKAAGFALLMRFSRVVFVDILTPATQAGFWTALQGLEWSKILAVLSVLTMTLGNLVALSQHNLKRLLAYSSIAHAGYMLMGLVVLSDKGLAAVLLYFVMYLFMNLGAFYVVMIVAEKTGSEDIDSYKGLGSRTPLVGVVMAIFLVSLTGLPPTAGFIGKLYLFAAVLDARWIWLAIVGVLNSVVSLYYYARVFRNIFLRDAVGSKDPLSFGVPQVVLLIVLAIPTLVLGLYFGPLVDLVNASLLMVGVH